VWGNRIEQPRVHDRRPRRRRRNLLEDSAAVFAQTKSIEELIPWLYSKGSAGDFHEALAALLGRKLRGCRDDVTRLKTVWEDEYNLEPAFARKQALRLPLADGVYFTFVWKGRMLAGVAGATPTERRS